MMKIVEQKNPYIADLVNAICDSDWIFIKRVDEFNDVGNELSFDGTSTDEIELNSYLEGRSTNPKVGRDQWQLNWIVEQIEKGVLDVSPQVTEDPSEIEEIKKEIKDLYSQVEDFEDGEDGDFEESLASKINKKFAKMIIMEADSIDFKTKITKDKAKVDKYASDKNLDQYDDETGEKTVYADDKGNVIGAYDNKRKKFYTNASKDDVDRAIGE